MAWRTSARYGTKQKRLDLASLSVLTPSACMYVCLSGCALCARARVCVAFLCALLLGVCVAAHVAVPGDCCHVPLGDGGYRVRLRDRYWPRVRQNALFFHILSIYGILKQTNRMKCQYVYGL
jgi:hypothetical protein